MVDTIRKIQKGISLPGVEYDQNYAHKRDVWYM